MHQPKLEAFEGGRMARSMSLSSQRTFVVGRNGAQADVVVADPSLSRQHAVIINSSSATFVQDLESAHGTWYDESGRTLNVPQLGVKLGTEPVKLVEGATLRFGTLKATVFRVTGLEQAKLERWQPPAWAHPPTREVRLEVRSNTVSNPYLAHLDEGSDVDEVLPLRSRCTAFGRSAQLVDIVVKDESVSRQHAAIVHSSEGSSFVVDIGSATGTYVDERRVSKDAPVQLTDGMAISVGTCRTTWTFRVGAAAAKGGGGGAKRQKR